MTVGVLRSRINEVAGETTKLRGELERKRKEVVILAALSKRRAALLEEVQDLEGDLADHNLAADKTRSGIDPAELAAVTASLAKRNAASSAEADAVYLRRTERDAASERLKLEASELLAAAEARVDALPAPQRAEYGAARSEARALRLQIARQQGVLEELNERVDDCEEALRSDSSREAHAALLRRRAALLREGELLRAELRAESSAEPDPGQARERLLARVRDGTARLAQLEAEGAEAAAQAGERRAALEDVARQLEERELDQRVLGAEAGGGGDGGGSAAHDAPSSAAAAKYEALFARDAEMGDFLSALPSALAREGEEQAGLRVSLTQLGARLEAAQLRSTALASLDPRQLGQLLSGRAAASVAPEGPAPAPGDRAGLARHRLRGVHAEFVAAATLIGRLEAEAASLASRMGAMRGELGALSDLPRVRAEADVRRRELIDRLRHAAQRADALAAQTSTAQAVLAEHRAWLSRDPHAVALGRLDAQIEAVTSFVADSRAYIGSTTLTTDPQPAKAALMSAAAELNVVLQRQLSRRLG